MHGSRRRLDKLDGVCMITPRVIACSRDIIVQGTQRAIAEVAAIIDSQPCGQPLCSVTEPTCWITGLRFTTVVRQSSGRRDRVRSRTMAIFLQVYARVWESLKRKRQSSPRTHDMTKNRAACTAGDLHLTSGQRSDAGRHCHLVNKTAMQ